MSWLSKATGVHISPHGAHLSRPDPIGTLKDVAHNPLPLLAGLALPGVGGLLGAIPGIGGALASGAGAVQGAVGGLGSGIAHAVEGIPGIGGAVGGAVHGIEGAVEGHGGLGGLLKQGAGWLTGNGGKNALGLAQGVSSVLDQKKSNEYANKAVGTMEGAYNEKAPLRAQGLQGMLAPHHEDLSGLANIAGKLNTSNVPQAGQPQDLSSLLGLQSQLQKFQMPTPGALQQFKPPPQAQQAPAPLPVDKGNPYAAQGA